MDVETKFYSFYNLEISPNNTFLIEGVSDLYVMYNYLTSNKHDVRAVIMIKNQIVENMYAPLSIIVNGINIDTYRQTIARIRSCNENFNKIIFTIDMDAVTCNDITKVLPYTGVVKKFIVNKSVIYDASASVYNLISSLLSHTKFKDLCIPRGSMVSYSFQDRILYIEDESKKFEALLLLQANL